MSLGKGSLFGSSWVSVPLLYLALAPASGFYMGGRPPFETLKGDLVPGGGHVECLFVFSDCCLCLEGRRASTAPLEGPGNPVAGNWVDLPYLHLS